MISRSAGQCRAEYMKPALFAREIRPRRAPYRAFHHVFIVTAGHAEATFDTERHALEALSALAFPEDCDAVLHLHAGAEAYLLGVSPELLIDVIGNKAESVLIRIFTERPSLISANSDDAGKPRADLDGLAQGFLREASLPGMGSEMAIAAYMRLILMELWRASGWQGETTGGRGQDDDILQRFRRLVEMHFRQRRPIGFYAQALGLSHDRLHAICTRTLGRAPKDLIQQRILQEANLRLERSGMPLQEIAHQLGFPDQTYFSHFYKRATGMAPNAYRRSVALNDKAAGKQAFAQFAEWP